MKKVFIMIAFVISNFFYSQKNLEVKKDTKFQVGLHYVGNVRNENIISDGFNGIVGISGNYAVYKDEMISVLGGLAVDYFQTRDYFLQNDIIIWNPNASIEVAIFKGKLRPFFGIGYAFFSNDFKFVTGILDPMDPALMQRERKLNFNGITVNPGIKYHVSDLLFIEGSYKYFLVKSEDFEDSANVHFINLGLGFKF